MLSILNMSYYRKKINCKCASWLQDKCEIFEPIASQNNILKIMLFWILHYLVYRVVCILSTLCRFSVCIEYPDDLEYYIRQNDLPFLWWLINWKNLFLIIQSNILCTKLDSNCKIIFKMITECYGSLFMPLNKK